MDYRTVRAKMRRPTERQKRAAANLGAGKTIMASMMDAGYTKPTAVQGMRAVPRTVLALMGKECNLIDVGRALDAEAQEALVRGRLVYNVIKGQDKGVNSAYRLGQDKRVNMFTAESQTGIVILNAPTVVGTNETEVPREVVEPEKDMSEPK